MTEKGVKVDIGLIDWAHQLLLSQNEGRRATLVSGIKKRVGKDGRVRSTYNILSQNDRIGSTNLCVHQIPRVARRVFVADEGHLIVTADYRNIEPRVAASLSGDRRLCDDINSGDLYAALADRIGCTRDLAKVVFMGKMYGMSVGGIAMNARVSREEAYCVAASLEARYSTLFEYKQLVISSSLKHGQILTGRGRSLPLNSRAREREDSIFAAHIQGWASNAGFAGVAELLASDKTNIIIPLISCHDEFVFEVPVSAVENTEALAEDTARFMSAGAGVFMGLGGVELPVKAVVGHNWSE
jgi:DNA polymerase-1